MFGLPSLKVTNYIRLDFNQLKPKLQSGEIEKWEIDKSSTQSNDPNMHGVFYGKDEKVYSVYLRYDPADNSIHPPFTGTPTETVVNWNETHRIFNLSSGDSSKFLPKIPQGYCDREIEEKVTPNVYDEVFARIDKFTSKKYGYELKDIYGDPGEDMPAMVKSWSNYNSGIELWITNRGYAAIYGDKDKFLVVGNHQDHPFVETNSFSFDNSDGSTSEDIDFPSLNLDQVKLLMKTKAIEYVFQQIH